MANDIFAMWDENKIRISDIPDIYTKNKYRLTRNKVGARKEYQRHLEEIEFPDMTEYVPSRRLLKTIPSCSFFLQFRFALATPYISRDDEEFYIIDNPVRKDKVFKVPMVSGSSWKGNMRWTAMRIFLDSCFNEGVNQNNIKEYIKCRANMVRIFGYEKDAIEAYLDSLFTEAVNDDNESIKRYTKNGRFDKETFRKFLEERGYLKPGVEGRRGRLTFYPTFFDKISLEVINPHKRTTKAGTQPIYIESVPVDASGTFSLLYIPFDIMGKPEDVVAKEVVKDLSLIVAALKEMMLTYGFSAKKSSGFGIVKEDIKGTFEMKGFPVYRMKSQGQGLNDTSPFAKLASLKKDLPPEKIKDDSFSSFKELEQLIDKVKKEVLENG